MTDSLAAQRQRCLTVATECTGHGVRKAARALSRIYDEAMAPAGLRGTQFNLLVALSLAPGAPVARVADELGLDRTTLTRTLGPSALGKTRWRELMDGLRAAASLPGRS
jgi:hypothetical protein